MTLNIQQETHGEALVIALDGTLAVDDAKDLEQALTLAAPGRPKLTILDMAGVTFISSLALGTMVSFQRGLTRHGCEVVLTAVPDVVLDVLQRAQLDQVFPRFNTIGDALAEMPTS